MEDPTPVATQDEQVVNNQINEPASDVAAPVTEIQNVDANETNENQPETYKTASRQGSLHKLKSGSLKNIMGSTKSISNEPSIISQTKIGGLVSSQQQISQPHNVDPKFANAKAFLQKTSNSTGLNLYDHLAACISSILEQRPENSVDTFELLSRDVKTKKSAVEKDAKPLGIFDVVPSSDVIENCKKNITLLQSSLENGESGIETEMPDMLEIARLFEWAGVSFGQEETFKLILSLKQLAQEKQLKSVRLFGKIFGLKSNYYVIESELGPDSPALETTEEQPAENGQDSSAELSQGVEDPELLALFDNLAKAKPQLNIQNINLPAEESVGVNKYVYWVSNNDYQMPILILIQAARKIKKQFSGDLSKKIVSYPPFKGTEADYLRCQIARISAGTVISPAGYYSFEQSEDNEENEDNSSSVVVVNAEYEGRSQEELLQPSSWVHHQNYILPQGRTSWINPKTLIKESKEEDGNEEENEEAEEGQEQTEEEAMEPETGPALLTTIEQDEDVESGVPAWTIRQASHRLPMKFSVVYARSNRWPGAINIGYRDKFANIYVGDGLKYESAWSIPSLPEVNQEYGIKQEKNEETGEINFVFPLEINEQIDPTLEEETAFEEAKKAKEEEKEEAAEEAENEGEEEDS
ncbi:Radial spokehead-like protein domain-containing protein [Rozella allomycis CSF55]|uniref:Radial spokehead-like protein domain-containing protein n=1 Tax=Rozella allomycis (strain CSF55) TaxID=988480 RepID=A0A075AR30_ROZAC|nr:Radial spokehead-like protein domain-containing protein [Rozella allomycis CSF55]|eukprot:EPZ32600.1 Radial spokehead-like protein domain-containing protein [Rozella allomycis CSF55]